MEIGVKGALSLDARFGSAPSREAGRENGGRREFGSLPEARDSDVKGLKV